MAPPTFPLVNPLWKHSPKRVVLYSLLRASQLRNQEIVGNQDESSHRPHPEWCRMKSEALTGHLGERYHRGRVRAKAGEERALRLWANGVVR
jgi:hypothetical protein